MAIHKPGNGSAAKNALFKCHVSVDQCDSVPVYTNWPVLGPVLHEVLLRSSVPKSDPVDFFEAVRLPVA